MRWLLDTQRLLVAQAQVRRVPIITADKMLTAYDVEVLPAGRPAQ